MKLRVTLNGTDKNPYEDWGLTQNPFPQIARAEYSEACLRLQSLSGMPIPKMEPEQYIRRKLHGFSEEFVQLVVAQYRPGEMVRFEVNFPEADDAPQPQH